MKRAWLSLAVMLVLAGQLGAGDGPGGFSTTLTAEQRQQMGLSHLTPGQLAALDAAVEEFRQGREASAVKQAATAAVAEYRQTQEPLAVQAAAAAAVDEYQRNKEPSVVARALDVLRRKHTEEQEERITAKITGRFSGWEGRTIFNLDNGQVWQQAAADVFDMKPATDVAVVVYKASSGYWRLRILDDKGAWVTVKRLK